MSSLCTVCCWLGRGKLRSYTAGKRRPARASRTVRMLVCTDHAKQKHLWQPRWRQLRCQLCQLGLPLQCEPSWALLAEGAAAYSIHARCCVNKQPSATCTHSRRDEQQTAIVCIKQGGEDTALTHHVWHVAVLPAWSRAQLQTVCRCQHSRPAITQGRLLWQCHLMAKSAFACQSAQIHTCRGCWGAGRLLCCPF